MAKLDMGALKGKLPTHFVEEKLSALPFTHKVLLLLMTVLVLGAGFYFVRYKPQEERYRKLRTTITQQEKRLAELKHAASQVEVVKKELAQSEAELAHLLTFLPDQKEIPGLLESVSQLGSQVGLENILFQPQAEQVQEFYTAVPVRLDLVGTYHELGVFFDKISKLDRILRVEGLTLGRQPNSSTLQVGCTVYTYRYSERPAPPPQPPKK